MGKELRFTGDDSWIGSYLGKDKDEVKLHRHLQERYDIEKPYTVKMDSGRTQEALNSRKKYQGRIDRAINNDYDVRRTLEAKALAGDEDARKFAEGGIKGIQDVSDVHTLFGREEGDDFGDQSDYSKRTMEAVDADRTKQNDFFNKKLEELKAGMKTDEDKVDETADVDIEESPEYSAAKKRLSEDAEAVGTRGASLFKNQAPTENPSTSFRKANEAAPTGNDQQMAATSYLNEYKKDVAQGAGLSQSPMNFQNAVTTVAGSGDSTKVDNSSIKLKERFSKSL